MINVNQLLLDLKSNVNTGQSGALPPINYNDFINQVNIKLAVKKIELFQTGQINTDDIAFLLQSVNIIVNVGNGGANFSIVPYPSDYKYFSSMRNFYQVVDNKKQSCLCPTAKNDSTCDKFVNSTIKYVPIMEGSFGKPIDNQRWGSLLQHKTMCPTWEQPKMTQFNGGFKVAPRDLSIVTLDYFRLPNPAKWAYTFPNNFPVYDPNNSVNLEWGMNVYNEFLKELVDLYSTGIRDPQLMQMNNALK